MIAAETEDAVFNLPEGSLVEVTMTVRVPVAATEDQIGEWLEHNLAKLGSIHQDNPLYSHEPDSFGSSGFEWRDTGHAGREETFDHQDLGAGRKTYRVRYHRERRA